MASALGFSRSFYDIYSEASFTFGYDKQWLLCLLLLTVFCVYKLLTAKTFPLVPLKNALNILKTPVKCWGSELLSYSDTPPIPGLPRVPYGLPIIGNLLQADADGSPCLTYYRWAQQLGPVFQMKFGVKRIVVVNSYDAAKVLWVDNMSSNCSRPFSYTFHNIVSSSQGLTIGTTPWSDTYKRKKKVTGSVLNKPAIRAYMGIIDYESAVCFKAILGELRVSSSDLSHDSSHDTSMSGSIDVCRFFNSYSLNTSLTLNYGTRLDFLDQGLLDEIMTVEKLVGKFRGPFASNLPDYLPVLKHVPGFLNEFNSVAVDTRRRRDRYMDALLDNLRHEIDSGTDIPCITGNILKAMNQTPPQIKLSESELKSICLTMVSAGLDTVPAIIILFIGHMSQDYGQQIQNKAYQEIISHFKQDPWRECLESGPVVPYIDALVKESLRFSGMPLSLPRELVRDVHYINTHVGCIGDSVLIPKGTTLVLNSFAANFDRHHFVDPFKFDPERYLKTGSSSLSAAGTGPAHFSFGAGLRMCCGSMLAEKEIYVAIVRLICEFHILPPLSANDMMPSDPFKLYSKQDSLMISAPPFKVRLVRRGPPQQLSRRIESSLSGSCVNTSRLQIK